MTETEIILRSIVLSVVTIGLVCPFWDGNIFDKYGDWVKSKIGEYIAKPLFACYVCATFWYSIIQCLIYGWPWWLCVPAMGVSAVISLMQKDG